MTTLAERVAAKRKALGLSQSELARKIGVTPQAIQKVEASETKRPRFLVELAKALKTTPEYLQDGRESFASEDILPSPNARIGDRVSDSPDLIPVYGQAVGGVHGEFELNGNLLFEVMAPPGISRANGAYAVSIAGDSMSPRYEDGEIAYVDPTRRVRRGDYVVAQIRKDTAGSTLAYVKRFVSHNAKELVLEQLNPPETLRFPHESVISVHYIVMAGART